MTLTSHLKPLLFIALLSVSGCRVSTPPQVTHKVRAPAPTADPSPHPGFTIAGWFKLGSDGEPIQLLTGKGKAETDREYLVYYYKSDSTINFISWPTAGSAPQFLSMPYQTPGQWAFVVARWDGQTHTKSISVNNSPMVATNCPSIYTGGPGGLYVSRLADGRLLIPTIYNRALTDGELAFVYKQALEGVGVKSKN